MASVPQSGAASSAAASSSSSSFSADLSMRETVLGMMRARDARGLGSIHTSDFRNLASDLGLPMGHPVIEGILLHCVISSEGFIDFSAVERELQGERRRLNNTVDRKQTTRQATSQPAPVQPWRPDLAHQQKMQSERQAKIMQEYQREVSDQFFKFTSGQLSEEQFVAYLESIGIVPTKNFQDVLRKNRCSTIAFNEFVRSLVKYDPSFKSVDTTQPAGGHSNLFRAAVKGREEVEAGLFYDRKRIDFNKKIDNINKDPAPRTPMRRQASNPLSPSGDERNFKTSLQDVIAFQNVPPVLLSQAQIDMRQGIIGSESAATNVQYSSEQRMLREQVLAALRKLDKGDLSLVEFSDRMFTMGIQLPELVLRELHKYKLSGQLNWSACVQGIDSHFFKHKSADVNGADEGQILELRQRMVEAIHRKDGASGLAKLTNIFRSMDDDNSRTLSFNEFIKGCSDFGLEGFSNADFRNLFNSFDKNGDGSLSFEEFIVALRGSLNNNRRSVLQTAFCKLDRRGEKSIDVDIVMESYNPSSHPDVRSGRKLESMIMREMREMLQNASNLGKLTFDQFMDYFANMSALIDSDDEFIDMMRVAFQVDPAIRPPPPDYAMGKGARAKDLLPMAKKTHGDYITWNQEPSSLEVDAIRTIVHKKTVNRAESGDSKGNIILWEGDDKVDTLRADGLGSRNVHSKDTSSLLAWDTKRRQPSGASAAAGGGAQNQTAPTPAQQELPQSKEESRARAWAEKRATNRNFDNTCPFGTTVEPKSSQSQKKSGGAPMSLSALLAKTN